SVTSESDPDKSGRDANSKFSVSGITNWAKNLKISQPLVASEEDSASENSVKSPLSRLTGGLGLRLNPKSSPLEENSAGASSPTQPGLIGTITKGLVDSSKNAVKAVQVKARHVVSQNKRRYQEGGFDLDMTYITENIIAMGFPSGDMSSGLLGYVEGFYRNHMEEVIRFFETHHKDKYKVYNLCSERLYEPSLFEGKVASFPFDDHNCPPIQLIISFCQSAYSWLKQDIENVVVVHCKAGMARTGLMISSLLLFLKFFPTAEESIEFYNQRRCLDGKGLVLPSQIRYVKYLERILAYFNGENQPARRCMLRGFRLHRCPYWIRPSITISDHNGVLFSTKKHQRTKDQSPEDFWFAAPKKGIMVFALPGEPGLTELAGDFKVHFHDRQGDFYCWLNTTMVENRKILNTGDLDGFDKRKLPSPGFQVEVVLVDHDPSRASISRNPTATNATTSPSSPAPSAEVNASEKDSKSSKHDEFSDSEADDAAAAAASKSRALQQPEAGPDNKQANAAAGPPTQNEAKKDAGEVSEFKAMAADASVFSFGDEDYESE
ncbi:hypothetical protein M569_00672, partial [Genlisea aurea]